MMTVGESFKFANSAVGSMVNPHPKILVVIVLYHCSLKDCKAYHSLATNSELQFFIHLNSEDCQLTTDKRIVTCQDFSNPGVSLAYNRAADYAKANDFDYLLLADQDSEFPENFLKVFYEARSKFIEEKIFFPEVIAAGQMISPAEFKWSRAWYAKPKPTFGLIQLQMIRPVNTGMLLSLQLFHEVGGYDQRVFLDYSDFYFIEKCLKKIKTGVLFSAPVIGELSDFESYSLIKIWKRYFLYLQSTCPLLFRKGYSLLAFWWILKLGKQIRRSFRF